ncbi:MAG: cation:proton antiporter, partial [Thermoprotei archaeon]
MDPIIPFSANTDVLLAVVGSIMLLGFVAEAAFLKYRIPESLGLMLIGVLLGPVTHVVSRSQILSLEQLAPFFGAIALVVIVFGGSSKIDFRSVASGGTRGLLLGVLDTVLTVAVVTPLFYYFFHWPLLISALFGALLGETTATIVIPIAERMGLDKTVFDAMTLDSTFNSVTCIVAFYIVFDAITSGFSGFLSVSRYMLELIAVGIFVGGLAGFLWVIFLSRLKTVTHTYMVTVGVMLGLYALVDTLGGSAILSVLVFGLVVANSNILIKNTDNRLNQQEVSGLHNEITFFIRTFFYVYMGLLITPSLDSALTGALIASILIVPRWIGVESASLGNRIMQKNSGLMTALYPRGLTVAVLAGIVLNASLNDPAIQPYALNMFNYAFMVILFSVV